MAAEKRRNVYLVSIHSRKGGVGKTTLALCAAWAAGHAPKGSSLDRPDYRSVWDVMRKEEIHVVLNGSGGKAGDDQTGDDRFDRTFMGSYADRTHFVRRSDELGGLFRMRMEEGKLGIETPAAHEALKGVGAELVAWLFEAKPDPGPTA